MPRGSSDSESEEKVILDPLPPHRVRFTDMPWPLVDKAIRRKYREVPKPNAFSTSKHSDREGDDNVEDGQGFGG